MLFRFLVGRRRSFNFIDHLFNYSLIESADSPGSTRAPPSAKRLAYDVGVALAVSERRDLKRRAEAERRSVANYVARLVVEELRAR